MFSVGGWGLSRLKRHIAGQSASLLIELAFNAGHGIGHKMHEAPQVPNFGVPGSGLTVKPRMTFCVEPMVMTGGEDVESLADGWTVVTKDGSDAAHFEFSLLVTEDGVEILTPWE